MELVVKQYEPIEPESMQPDPAAYAAAHGLVGDHAVETREQIGAWRWQGIFDHRHRILELLQQSKGAVDFGGAAGPVGYGAHVVDFWHPTTRAFWDIQGKVDLVFSSHTFEHVPDLGCLLGSIFYRLERPGHLIVFVPSYRLEHLRADRWPHHCHTFRLSSDTGTDPTWIPLDALLAQAFEVELATHTTDGCILVIARVGE